MSVGEGSVMEWIERRPQRMLQSGDGDVKVLATGPQGMHRLQGTAELQRVNGLRIRTKDGVKEFSVDPRGIASTAVKE